MNFKRITAALLAGMMALSLAACSSGQTSDDSSTTDGGNTDSSATAANPEAKVFTMGHSNPADPDDQYHYFCLQLNENLQEICDGAIQFEFYTDNQFGTEAEMFQYVSDGTLDSVCISNNIVSGSIPELQVLDLPYFFESEAEYQHLVDDEEFLNTVLPIFENDWNMVQIAPVLDASWRTLYTKGKAVETFEDLKDMKVRVTTNRVHEAAYKAMGAIPSVIAWGECYTAFQQNVIDGLDVGVPIAQTMGFYEVSDYCSRLNPFPIMAWPMMNKDLWDSLTEEEQGWITEAATQAALDQRTHQREMETKFTKEQEAAGIQFFSPDLTPFKEATESVRQQFIPEIGEDFYNQCVATVEEFRASQG